MTIEQWNSLRLNDKEKLISMVFNNDYISVVHAYKDPEKDPVIKEVLSVCSINGDTIYINIHKELKIKK